MKKIIFVTLFALSFVAQATTPIKEETPDMLRSYGKGLKSVEEQSARRMELQSKITLANLKIAAFELEIAKAKFDKAVAESSIDSMEKNK
ncbi:hypothetical protein VIK251_00023 [Klebsiella phage vB_KpnM_VIK251]|nr:hypothetical protein VIK251_00023 [Klebsiella phage vB_KpnM_VIK251]